MDGLAAIAGPPARTAALSGFGRLVGGQRRADLALLTVAAVWGATFVMVKEAVVSFPVFGFLAIRFAIATVSLLPLCFWLEWRPGELGVSAMPPARRTICAGAILGLALMAGYAFQTHGLRHTTAAKAAFITGLAVVIVPVLAAVLLRDSPARTVWLGVLLATAGLALLTLNRALVPELGDGLVFLCAIAFALHLLITGILAPGHPPLTLTAAQLAMVTALTTALSLAREAPLPRPDGQVIFVALFTGLLATTFAFTVQTAAQRVTSASHTALIFSTEPVFGALFSYLLVGEVLAARALVGCGLILAGMIVAEWRPASRAGPGHPASTPVLAEVDDLHDRPGDRHGLR